jgi:hypothetical protein
MNNKLVFVGIMAIVAGLSVATIAVPFQSAHAQNGAKSCSGGPGINVNALCNAQVCANVGALAQRFAQFCQNR